MVQAALCALPFAQRVPALGLEVELGAVLGDELLPELGPRDVANDFDVGNLQHALMVGEGNGEEKFVVLPAVEGCGIDIHVELFGRDGCLIVHRDAFLIDAAAHTALLADVHGFGREAVADVHHGRGVEPRPAQRLHDIAAGFRLQETLDEVFAPREVGLGGRFAVGLLALEYAFLALHELEAEVGGAEVAGHAEEIGVLRSGAVDNIGFIGLAHAGEAQRQSGERGGGVAADEVHAVLFASEADAFVEGLEVLDLRATAHGQADKELARGAVHGIDVGEIDHGGLVAQVLQRRVGEVEVDALHQHVGGEQDAARVGCIGGVAHHGAVVAYAAQRGGVAGGEAAGEVVDEAKLTEG